MRRLIGVLAGVVLVVGALAVGSGAKVFTGPLETLPVQVTKVVAGDAPPGATYVVAIACASGAPDQPELIFNSAGSAIVKIPKDTVCTFTETQAGGALQTSTAASCVSEPKSCTATVTGPTSATVKLLPPDGFGFEAEVTFSNVFVALQVAPTAAVAGETVTISGTGCITDEPNEQGVAAAATTPGVVTGNVAFTPPVPFGPINAAADGTWSTTIVVPPGTPAGTYAVNATCTLPVTRPGAEVSSQASGTFQYAPGSLTIAVPAVAAPAVAVPAAPSFTG